MPKFKIKAAPGFRVRMNNFHTDKPVRKMEAKLTPQQKVEVEKYQLKHPEMKSGPIAAKLGLTKSLVDDHMKSAGRAIAKEIALGQSDAENPMVKP